MLSSLLRPFSSLFCSRFRLFLSLKKLFFSTPCTLNITIDKSLFICTIECAIFCSVNWLVSYLKLDTKRRLGSVLLECLFFFYVNGFDSTENSFFIKGSQFYRQRVWAVADSLYRGTGAPAKDGLNTEMFLQVGCSRMPRPDFAQTHRLALILKFFHC